MRFGLFCTYENSRGDYAAAYREQAELVELVEKLGFDEAWVTEHHFNPSSPSSSPVALLANLAGRTKRLRIGSAAVLLPFHHPIRVAEDVATIDLLSGGRFNFGVAKGGPFPSQNKHFSVDPQTSRRKTLEALALIRKLLSEEDVRFLGEFYQTDGVSIAPKPLQSPVPIFIATSTLDLVKVAAEDGHAVMNGPPFPLETVRQVVDCYREAARGAGPRLVLARFLHVAPTHERAVEEARPLLQPFVERMAKSTAAIQPEWTSWFELERLMRDSLIGTAEEIKQRVALLQAEIGVESLLLKPLSPDQGKRRAASRTNTLVAARCAGWRRC